MAEFDRTLRPYYSSKAKVSRANLKSEVNRVRAEFSSLLDKNLTLKNLQKIFRKSNLPYMVMEQLTDELFAHGRISQHLRENTSKTIKRWERVEQEKLERRNPT